MLTAIEATLVASARMATTKRDDVERGGRLVRHALP